MELEFDKEIDALLRRASGGVASAVSGEHLDADALAAYAEGALPARVRPFYTRHLADCDRCRKLLSEAVAMNTAAPLAADVAASSVDAPVGGSSWISNLFRTPSFAVAMGALTLVFGGVFAYMALRNQGLDRAATVSRSETEMQKGGPYAGVEPNEVTANSNTAVSAADSAANMPTNSSVDEAPAKSGIPNSPTGPSGDLADEMGRDDSPSRKVENQPVTERDADKAITLDGAAAQPKPGAAPPTAAPVDKTTADREQEKLRTDDYRAKEENKNEVTAGVRQETEDRLARGNVATAKKKDAGPTRSGPVQSQSQINTQTYEMSVTRAAGGKKFTNRGGAWYDTAYRGQPTVNVRRGTDAYNKLDSGLRSIGETLGGTVVVVWKDKAYRIQ